MDGFCHIEINHDWCKNCYICVELCPKKVFKKADKLGDKGKSYVEVQDINACTGCMQCELLCPDLAIVVTKEPKN